MVKCSDCGFLCVLSQEDWTYIEADIFYRQEGYSAGALSPSPKAFVEPHCSIHFQAIHSEPLEANGGGVQLTDPGGGLRKLENLQGEDVTDKAVVGVITKPRACEGFFSWKPGFSPKEHFEMLEQERRQKWQEEQSRSDRRWRIIEIIVLGIIVTLLAGGFTILGAFIERGSLFPP